MNSLTIRTGFNWLENLEVKKRIGLAKAVNLNGGGTNPTLFLFRGVKLHLVRRRLKSPLMYS